MATRSCSSESRSRTVTVRSSDWWSIDIGNGIGADAYQLRRSDALWVVPDLRLTPTGRRAPPVLAQEHQELEGEARELLPLVPLEAALHDASTEAPHEPAPPSFYPDVKYDG